MPSFDDNVVCNGMLCKGSQVGLLPKLDELGFIEQAVLVPLVLGKFSPGPIGTRSGLDQTPQSQSRSGIFPKKPDRPVSSLGIPILPETIQTRSGPGPHNCYLHK